MFEDTDSSSESDSDFDDSEFDDNDVSSDFNQSDVESDGTIDYDVAGSRPSSADFVWSVNCINRSKLPFSGSCGLKVDIADKQDPLDYFRLFIMDTKLAEIEKETNRRAQQLRQNPALKPNSRLHYWDDVTRDELRVFISGCDSQSRSRNVLVY